MAPVPTGRWLVEFAPATTDAVLLCLPPAGAGSRRYGSWQGPLADVAQVIGVQPPGRENRWGEPMPDSVEQMVAEVVEEVTASIGPQRPLTVFGHSFGGLLGYELTRALTARHPGRVRALVVSACRPPEYWDGAGRGILDDEASLNRLFDAGGPEVAALDAETRALMLEVLRRDARLSLSYRHADHVVLDVPIHAWGGADDDTVTAGELDGWAAHGARGCTRLQFPGGHHTVLDSTRTTLPLLRELLDTRPDHEPA